MTEDFDRFLPCGPKNKDTFSKRKRLKDKIETLKAMKNTENKTGVELIAEERKEQIEKHGFSVTDDADYYSNFELIQAALFCLDESMQQGYGLKTGINWPINWDRKFKLKIIAKDKIGKLKVAGALIAAEIDRLQNS